MPDLKSLGWLSGEWFYLLIVEEPTKTALRLGENITACGVGMPRADGPQASPVKLLTPTALKPKPPAAVRMIRILSDMQSISQCCPKVIAGSILSTNAHTDEPSIWEMFALRGNPWQHGHRRDTS